MSPHLECLAISLHRGATQSPGVPQSASFGPAPGRRDVEPLHEEEADESGQRRDGEDRRHDDVEQQRRHRPQEAVQEVVHRQHDVLKRHPRKSSLSTFLSILRVVDTQHCRKSKKQSIVLRLEALCFVLGHTKNDINLFHCLLHCRHK